jgi:2',3'-cyclic-nucleotide 2'-phosphodiesterase/3'-nucleotidase
MMPVQASLRSGMEKWLDEPIGHLSRSIWPEDKLKMAMGGSPIANFFNAVQLWASGAEISCTGLPNEIRGFEENVTVRDVVSTYVYSNTLAVLRVTGKVLREALEQCATYFDRTPEGKLTI